MLSLSYHEIADIKRGCRINAAAPFVLYNAYISALLKEIRDLDLLFYDMAGRHIALGKLR